MSSKSKGKGTRYETQVANFINDWAGERVAERVALHGNHDNGDLRLVVDDLTLCVECKWREKYPPDSEERDFRRQTDEEADNSGADGGILVINRYRAGIERHEVWMHMGTAKMLVGDRWGIARDDHDWVCTRLLDFCWICFGGPAWGRQE